MLHEKYSLFLMLTKPGLDAATHRGDRSPRRGALLVTGSVAEPEAECATGLLAHRQILPTRHP
ncbi:hypothetical protein [Amycolatopsis sp. lyj-23]|uniref:hypothetical protein n=1 Tax=Amycolatopsis sp. lyj-23 TaxID=2789283 RepID=UPI00397D6AB8